MNRLNTAAPSRHLARYTISGLLIVGALLVEIRVHGRTELPIVRNLRTTGSGKLFRAAALRRVFNSALLTCALPAEAPPQLAGSTGASAFRRMPLRARKETRAGSAAASCRRARSGK